MSEIPLEDPLLDNVTNTQSFKVYNKQHKQLFEKITSCQKNISKEDRGEVVSLYQLYKNEPEKYELLIQEKIISLIGKKNFLNLQESVKLLQNSGDKLRYSKEYLALSDQSKEKLARQLVYNLPSISKLMSSKRIMTRSVSESECIADCAKTRDEAIELAAYTALCRMGTGLAVCLASGGRIYWWTYWSFYCRSPR